MSKIDDLIGYLENPDYERIRREVEADPSLVSMKRDGSGRTLLHLAANDSQPELARLLIQHGADVNASDPSEGTPLHLAAESGSLEIVRMLLSHGAASVNVQDGRAMTPLDWAALKRNDDVVKVLIDHGATTTNEYTLQHIRRLREHGLL